MPHPRRKFGSFGWRTMAVPMGAWMTSNPSPQSLARWRAVMSRAAAAMWAAMRTVETIAVTAAGACAIVASLALVPGARGVAGAGLALLMFAIAAVDMRRFIIPDELTVLALALGLVHAGIDDVDPLAQALAWSLLRGAVVGLGFLAIATLYRRLRGRDGIGLGDVKLAGVAGVWLDWSIIPIAVEIAALAALGTYLVRHLCLRRVVSRTTRLPFGLFLAPAIWIGWFLEAALLLYPSGPSF
jgi:leader peptidase (prepilin peptidase)/N-methyltransferase